MLSVMTLAASCVSEIEGIDVSSVKSKDIIFGGVITDDIIITRSGDSGPIKTAESKVTSESGDVSLPVIVEVEKGIKGAYSSGPATRASITRDVNTITQLDAWAIYTKYTDENHTDFEDRYLYFDENKVNGAALSFSKNETDGIFYSDGKIYPWPGDATAMFNFVTVSPVNSGFQARHNTMNNIVSFDYTVPADASLHKDILVASPDMIQTDFRKPVPLTFKHVMAAVNVKVGEVPNGKITSVKFTGVYNKASYFPDGDGWVNRTIADGGEFSVDLPDGGVTVGTQSNGTTLTTGEAGFMMIPQQLYTGAELQVTFLPDDRTEPLVLRASIQGDIWEMNTTTNYWISINPDYMISIVPLDNLLDSHYIITKVEVSSEYPSWQLVAVADDGADVTLQLESEVNSLVKDGFWTDKVVNKSGNSYTVTAESARGTNSVSGSQVESQIVYVFIPENISNKKRNVTLTLIGLETTGGVSQPKTITLEQSPVMWLKDPMSTGNPDAYWGCELILEGGQVGWGFCWDGLNATFILKQGGASYDQENDQYGAGNIPSGQRKQILPAMELAGIDVNKMSDKIYDPKNPNKEIDNPNYDPNYYIQVASSGQHEYFIRVDLSKISNIGVAEDDDNGWQNTFDVYHFEGISVLKQLIDFCNSWGDITNPDGRATLLQNSLEYAVLYAMKRNKFYYYEEDQTVNGTTIGTMIVPVIFDKDINWYLPAKDQFPYFMNENWGQAFTFNDLFWTSTAYLESSDTYYAHTYAYLNGIETISHRNDKYLTFALRRYTLEDNAEIDAGNTIVPGGGDNGPEYGGGGDGKEDGGPITGGGSTPTN